MTSPKLSILVNSIPSTYNHGSRLPSMATLVRVGRGLQSKFDIFLCQILTYFVEIKKKSIPWILWYELHRDALEHHTEIIHFMLLHHSLLNLPLWLCILYWDKSNHPRGYKQDGAHTYFFYLQKVMVYFGFI